jgi:hypothetical protein
MLEELLVSPGRDGGPAATTVTPTTVSDSGLGSSGGSGSQQSLPTEAQVKRVVDLDQQRFQTFLPDSE